MAPERHLERGRYTKLDGRVVDGGPLGQKIDRVDADLARLERDGPAFVDGLDHVPRFELREVGVPLRRARVRVGLDDRPVALQHAATEDAERRAPCQRGGAGLGVLVHVGRAVHAAEIEDDRMDDA
jgi:hypothetical protein